MAEIDTGALLQEAQNKDADFDGIRSRIDAATIEDDAAIQAAREAITTLTGTPEQRLLAETTFARVWPKIQARLQSADAGNVAQVAVDVLGQTEALIKPLIAQEVIEHLSMRGLNEDSIAKHVLIPSSPKLGAAVDAQARNQRSAVIARHNVSQAQQGTKRFVEK